MLCLLIEDIPMKTKRNILKGKEIEKKAIETIGRARKKINTKIKKKNLRHQPISSAKTDNELYGSGSNPLLHLEGSSWTLISENHENQKVICGKRRKSEIHGMERGRG